MQSSPAEAAVSSSNSCSRTTTILYCRTTTNTIHFLPITVSFHLIVVNKKTTSAIAIRATARASAAVAAISKLQYEKEITARRRRRNTNKETYSCL